MCVYCFFADYIHKWYPWEPLTPVSPGQPWPTTPVQPWPVNPVQPYPNPTGPAPTTPPMPVGPAPLPPMAPYPSPRPWTREQLEETLELVRQIKEMEDALGGCPCEEPSKLDFLQEIRKRLDALEAAQKGSHDDEAPEGDGHPISE